MSLTLEEPTPVPAPAEPSPAALRAAAEIAVPVAVVGCDFRVASSSWRNRLLLDRAERLHLAGDLRRACGAEGLVVLETCNRVEWIVVAAQPQWAADIMRAQMVERWVGDDGTSWIGRGSRATLPVPYLYTGRAAVQHLLRVAVGLESFVVGEREIAGQLNRALAQARAEGLASPWHNALQTAVGRTVKKVQRLTHWRHHARGVQGLAVQAIRQALPPLQDRRREIAVVGMGEIGRKTAGLLASGGGYRVLRINRTVPPERAGEWLRLDDALGEVLQRAEAIVVATGAHGPTVDLTGLHHRRSTPLVVVDLGAPAQVRVRPASAHHHSEPVLYHGLDELLTFPSVAPNPNELQTVTELVDEGVREFLVECKKRDLAGLLRVAHDLYDKLSYEELPAFLEGELADLDVDRRRRLEASLRSMLRTYARSIVQHIETAAATDAGRAK